MTEPVSAIYIISIASKLRQPSLLKIQHCVALDKAGTDNHLSFYRSGLKEPTPPYFFKRIKGGKFDINNQYGELELPVFCAILIGNESTTCSDESSDSINDTPETSSGVVSDIDQLTDDGSIDSNIIFLVQIFYLEKRLNQWEMRFTVVKHLPAFTSFIKSQLRGHEANVTLDIQFSSSHIELTLDENNNDKFKGWCVEKFSEPCAVPYKRASAFGYVKEVSIPPMCLIDVFGDNSVPNYTQRLNYPVLLKGSLAGTSSEEATVFIKRIVEEKVSTPQQQQQQQQLQARPILTINEGVPIHDIINCIKQEFNKVFPELKELFMTHLDRIAAELLAVHLVTNDVATNPTSDNLIKEFHTGFLFLRNIQQVNERCHKFFRAMYKIGGNFALAADTVKEQLQVSLLEKFNISLDL